MPLGYNRRYNDLRGLPVSGSVLNPTAPKRGTVALWGDDSIPCVVETEPKTGAGLPTGSEAEQYVVDFGPSVWRIKVYGNGATVSPGDALDYVITTGTTAVPAGTATNANTASTGLTFTKAEGAHQLMVLDVVGGASIVSGNTGDADVMINA